MANDENIIDRGEADITAFDLLNLNEPTPFTEKLESTYSAEDKISRIDPTSVVPGVISALTTDTLGAVNVLNPLYVGEGESEDYGAWDYFSDVFGGAISGEVPKGEMFISNEDINANPNLKEWLENTQKIMQQNASEQIHEFAKDKRLMDDAAFQQYYDDLAAKDPDMKLPETKWLNKIMTQFHEPQPYEIDTPNNGIIIKENLLPEISRDVDPKFTKDGDLSLPYAGKFGYNDAGEFVMKRPSMFRFTDELTRGKEGSAWLEATEDMYCKLSPITEALATSSDYVHLSKIKPSNLMEWYYRLDSLFDAGLGFLFSETLEGEIPIRLTINDLKDHLGLRIDTHCQSAEKFDRTIRNIRMSNHLKELL